MPEETIAWENEKATRANDEANKNWRGGFPKDRRTKTMISLRETKDSRLVVDLVTKCNDQWLNSHCRACTEPWQANTDWRLTIDVGKIVGYMTKYVNKTESSSNARTARMMFSTMRRTMTEDGATVDKTLRRLMTKVC